MSVSLIQDARFVKTLCAFIEHAERQIIIIQYQFRAPKRPGHRMAQLLAALLSAANRGVLVTILLNRPNRPRRPGPSHGALPTWLLHPNIKILHHTRQEILHIKAIAIDAQTLILGSHNLSHASFTTSRNISAVIQDHNALSEFLHMAEPLLKGGTDGTR